MTTPTPFRFAVIGCGFWAQVQLNAWAMIEDVELVAVCDVDEARAREAAAAFGASRAYADAAAMLAAESLDFVDIVTTPPSHRPLVELAAQHGVDVICQKPLAWSMADAAAMVAACQQAGVRFMVHENWRWQSPIRALKRLLDDNTIGRPFFGRVSFRSDFDPFSGQPWLRQTPRFVIVETGTHMLDVARFLMGDPVRLFATAGRQNPTIQGEDVATILLAWPDATCLVDLSFATPTSHELFPQTLITLEGPHGVLMLDEDYRLRIIRPGVVETRALPQPGHPWTSRPWHVMQDSALHLQRHWVECLRTGRELETSGVDNLKTLELVFGAYASVETGQSYQLAGRTWP